MNPRPLRIALVTRTLSSAGGGVAEIIRLLLEAFQDSEGVEFELFGADLSGAIRMPPAAKSRQFLSLGPRNYAFSPGMVGALLRSDADLVHVHGLWSFHVLAAHIWHLVTRRPYLVTPHGMLQPWIVRRSPTLKAVVSALYQRRFLLEATAVQVNSEAERDELSVLGLSERAVVVPNYAETQPSRAVPPAWLSPDLQGRTVYLFLGRIHPKKGIEELLDAWELLSEADLAFNRTAALVVCGWIDGSPAIEERLKRLARASSNVVFAGPQFGEDKVASLDAADFFVLPSKSEGQPMAVLEAWAQGLPTIITAECNLPGAVARNACLLTRADAASIAETIQKAQALSESERARLAVNARQLLAEEYSRKVVNRRMRLLYENCIAIAADRGGK
jgi:glycosyltransferase involved in cell wall biosynthesis